MQDAPLKHRKEQARPFKKGDTIFLKGDLGNSMFVLLKGQVEIRLDDRVVDVVHEGGIFGEMGLVENAPRAATAVAVTNGAVLSIDEDQFIELVQEQPFFAIKVVRQVADRVRRANATHAVHVQ
ncbi:MAG: cyclic nucleotide-binding domain-containing protein [Candidatus Eremiobacteraeota bacterium]|nr:cyclic nucleotide-binding domain-containing protein [Candidatus Eremiobacteraeota bacterium]